MKNLKDTLTTVIGLIGMVCGVIVSLPGDPEIITPTVKAIAGTILGLTVGILGYLTGKNPNGTTKVIDPATGQQDVDPNAVKK